MRRTRVSSSNCIASFTADTFALRKNDQQSLRRTGERGREREREEKRRDYRNLCMREDRKSSYPRCSNSLARVHTLQQQRPVLRRYNYCCWSYIPMRTSRKINLHIISLRTVYMHAECRRGNGMRKSAAQMNACACFPVDLVTTFLREIAREPAGVLKFLTKCHINNRYIYIITMLPEFPLY